MYFTWFRFGTKKFSQLYVILLLISRYGCRIFKDSSYLPLSFSFSVNLPTLCFNFSHHDFSTFFKNGQILESMSQRNLKGAKLWHDEIRYLNWLKLEKVKQISLFQHSKFVYLIFSWIIFLLLFSLQLNLPMIRLFYPSNYGHTIDTALLSL